jgi:tetratricopeptide (TPR) repeat protein
VASPLYRFGYYPHNVHFLMVSAQMAGLASDVIAAADRLVAITSDAVSEELAWVQAIRTAPYTGHAQFSEPDVILALPDPGPRFPFVRGFWHYARGLAEARAGRPEAALAEVRAIRALVETADLDGLEEQYLPARDILAVAGNVVEAKVAAAAGDVATAEAPPPRGDRARGWHRLHGAALLVLSRAPDARMRCCWQAGRPEEAAEAFRAALAQTPRNGWALWGLAEAERATGADPAATEAALEKAWLGDRALPRHRPAVASGSERSGEPAREPRPALEAGGPVLRGHPATRVTMEDRVVEIREADRGDAVWIARETASIGGSVVVSFGRLYDLRRQEALVATRGGGREGLWCSSSDARMRRCWPCALSAPGAASARASSPRSRPGRPRRASAPCA